MKKVSIARAVILSCAFLMLVGILNAADAQVKPAPKQKAVYNVACGPEGNTGYVVGGGIFPYMDKWTGGKVNVLPIASGSIAAVRNVSESANIQGVFIDHVTLEEIWTNTGQFAGKPLKKKLYQTLYGWPTAWALWAKANSNIKSYADLAGKTISVGDAKSSYVAYIVSALQAMGLWDKVKNRYMGVDELPDALKSGIIDAAPVAIAANVISPWGEAIALYNNMTALSITEQQIAALKRVPAMSFGYATPIKAPKSLGLEKIPAFFMYYGYHFAEYTDADTVYAIVKAWFDHQDQLAKTYVGLAKYNEEWKQIQIEAISAARHAPIHPGAARYFKEAGIWRDNWIVGKYIP